MSYTVLRIGEAGVVLFDGHRSQSPGPAPRRRRRFCDSRPTRSRVSTPSLFATALSTCRRGRAPRSSTGCRFIFLPSPAACAAHPLHKSPPPNGYSAVRLPGVATLLTSEDGGEIYKSCAAAVVAWDGELLAPPPDRPRLWSTAMEAVARLLPVRSAPLRVDSAQPLALLNAVAGVVLPEVPGREPFPEPIRQRNRGSDCRDGAPVSQSRSNKPENYTCAWPRKSEHAAQSPQEMRDLRHGVADR